MRQVSRYLLGIVTFVVPVFIAACYGMAYTFSQRGRVVDKGSKAGVSGMRVQCVSTSNSISDTTYSQADGSFVLYSTSSSTCATIAVRDDSEVGAHYAPTSVKSNSSVDLVIEVAPLP
jgi:hypothetical protein